MNNYKQAIIDYVRLNPGLTANSIAVKGLGKTKAREGVRSVIQDLVDEGIFNVDRNGLYHTFSFNGATDEQVISSITNVSTETAEEEVVNEELVEYMDEQPPMPADTVEVSAMQEDSSEELEEELEEEYDYDDEDSEDIEEEDPIRDNLEMEIPGFTPIYKDGSLHITCPAGDEIRLGDEEHLLIINGKPLYTVTTPEDVFRCIFEFTKEQGYKEFVVSDIYTNEELGNDSSIQLNSSRMLALEISKHNKAAK